MAPTASADQTTLGRKDAACMGSMETALRLSRLQEKALEEKGACPVPSQLWWDDDVGFEPNYTPGQLAGSPMSLADASKCHRKMSWAVPNLNMLNQGIQDGKKEASTWPETGHKPGRTLKLRQTQHCFGNVLSRIMLRPMFVPLGEGTRGVGACASHSYPVLLLRSPRSGFREPSSPCPSRHCLLP